MPDEMPPPWPTTGSPLDAVNADFHASYDSVRHGVALADPVLVFIDHALVVVWNQSERRIAVTPRAFHLLKSIAHAPVGTYALLWPARDAPLAPHLQTQIQGLLARLQLGRQGTLGDIASSTVRDSAAQMMEACVGFLSQALADQSVTEAALDHFASKLGPSLLELTDEATRLELGCLHSAVQEALASLPEATLPKLQVVVVGDHQARERSLAMQYFRKRLEEPEGIEDRVAFAEGLQTVEQALALVGTRRLDRQLAYAFFGEARRLQRDVLGDSAKSILDATALDRIE